MTRRRTESTPTAAEAIALATTRGLLPSPPAVRVTRDVLGRRTLELVLPFILERDQLATLSEGSVSVDGTVYTVESVQFSDDLEQTLVHATEDT